MKRPLCCTLPLVLAAAFGVAQAETRTLVVDAVEDGDTLVVTLDGKSERLQLLGIDAPEDVDNAKHKRDVEQTGLGADALLVLGTQATAHLKGLVAAGQSLEVSGDFEKRDRYGRIDVLVRMAGAPESLNERLVADGYAVMLRSYPFKDDLGGRLEGLEEMALATERGLWAAETRAATLAWSGRIAASSPEKK